MAWKDDIEENIKCGLIEILILSLLSQEDMYGYQMTQEIKKRSGGQLTLIEGSMYTILNRLKDYGDVTFRQVQSGPRMIRVYYSITDTGRQHLEEMRVTFNKYVDIINDLIQK